MSTRLQSYTHRQDPKPVALSDARFPNKQDLSSASFGRGRTWREFVTEKARAIGLGATLTRAALGARVLEALISMPRNRGNRIATLLYICFGLSPIFSWIRSPEARGEIISTFGTQEAAKARALPLTYAGGGNEIYIRIRGFDSSGGAVNEYGSGTLVNGESVATAAHLYSAFAHLQNLTFSVGLSSDFTQPTLEIPVSSWQLHPFYGGTAGAGIDLCLGRLASSIHNVTPVPFWQGTPLAVGSDVLKVGYGLTGTRAAYAPSLSGPARAVFSTLTDEAPFLGSAQTNVVTRFTNARADGGSAGPGDSGGGGYQLNPNSSSLQWRFMQLGGATGAPGLSTELLDLTAEYEIGGGVMETPIQWIQNNMTAVPEPNSLAMAVASGIALFALRRTTPKPTRRSHLRW